MDSDVDPATGTTAVVTLSAGENLTSLDAGLVVGCSGPDEPVYIYTMTVTDDGNDYPVLHFMDPNQPADVTGYNLYRSDDPGLPQGSWPMVASNVIDMDEATPNKQWVDTSGDVAPGGTWYYQVAAYSSICIEEGPW